MVAKLEDVTAMELNEKDVTLYFSDGKSLPIVFSEHKEYIALNDPDIPSLYQNEPLSIAESPQIDPDKPMVAITFDDGPNPATTPELLDLLKKYDVRSTFFMVGKNAEANPDIVKRIYQEGHELGNHSWDHADLSQLSEAQIIEELQSTDDAIFKACGHDPLYIRPPLAPCRMCIKIRWTEIRSCGPSTPGTGRAMMPARSKRSLILMVSDGSIILLHDIHEDSVKAMRASFPNCWKKDISWSRSVTCINMAGSHDDGCDAPVVYSCLFQAIHGIMN